jgi:hypothetical protein
LDYWKTSEKNLSYLRIWNMKIIRSSRRHHCVARVSIFLIAVALIVGMVGCGGGGKFDLNIASTTGGTVTTPGEGTFTYYEGIVFDLVAEPEAGYYFVNWTGDVGTITDINAATTTITMNGDYSIKANFESIPADQYSLTISSTTEGWLLCGNVTTPGEGTFIYSSGTVANLVAQAEEGCQFVGWTGDVDTIADINAATTTITMNGDYSIRANFRPYVSPLVAAGSRHTVGLKPDGTVVAVGDNASGQCNVGGWINIVQVAAGNKHTVGLRSDGTVVAVGDNSYGQCDVGSRSWTGIVQVAAGNKHTVGLRSDGTVVAVGDNAYGQCNVVGWTNIVQVAAGYWHTVGLKPDGTVVAVGDNTYGQCNVSGWTNITQVATSGWHTVGLRFDGIVFGVGDNPSGQCNFYGWTNIVLIAAGYYHTVGLESDGTVVTVGQNDYGQRNVGGWTNIVQVAAGSRHTVGLKPDGTVVTVGDNSYGQCDAGDWDLF